MKIGFNLLLWTGFVEEDLYPTIEKIKETGYDGVEIPLFDGDVEHYQKVGQFLKDAGLKSTAVTVMPDQQRSAVSPDAASREGAKQHLRWAIDCCEAMGSETLLGPFHQVLGEFTGVGATDEEKANAAEVHRDAAEYAQNANVVLAIEYLNRFECYFLNTMDDAAAYVKQVDHPNFGTMYDTFHANIEEKDPVGVIAPNIGVINHVHISENDRGTPGAGHVEFAPVFAALKGAGYDGWLTVEAFGRALPELAAATRVWRDFFPSREEVYEKGFPFIRDGWANA
ncbi:MAG: sugar phosphate isomerase/epimerase family protein [Planctomycetota bacterium]|jgi:D-psicose/D-tagatose/L-ribulose 3-epimerase